MEPQCYYDTYAIYTQEAIEDIKPKVSEGLENLRAQLRQTRPYILTEDVVMMILETTHKAGESSFPYAPFPKLPFWVEFEDYRVGSEQEAFVALFACKDPSDSKIVMVQLLTADLMQAKSLFFNADGHWEFEQIGRCPKQRCPVARGTVENEPYRITQCVAREWLPKDCDCSLAGHVWAQFVNVLNHLLAHRKEPLLESIAEREIALPYSRDTKLKREKIANSDARKRSRPNITTISLSAPVQISRREKSSAGAQSGQDITMEKMSIEGYYKVLIPGEGKPWKSLQIIPVSSYERRQKPAEVRSRVRVEV